MKRTSFRFTIDHLDVFKKQLLRWAQQFREVAYLDSNHYPDSYHSMDAVLATDAFTLLQTDEWNAFNRLEEYHRHTQDWLFGYLSYDLKNDVEDLHSQNNDELNFPELFFFQPKKIFFIEENEVRFEYLTMCEDEAETDFKDIVATKVEAVSTQPSMTVKERVSLDDYRKGFDKMMHHIQRGDIYEANYCMEFYAENSEIEPANTFWNLNQISEPPFACFGKFGKHFVLSASPERYLKKQGTKVISQPIKGTAKRGLTSEEDEFLKQQLKHNSKEQSENVMIVDLVRNDLSRTAVKGSVEVEELFGIYSFKQVHQMISTVVSDVSENENPLEIIRTTFPMGSMTGAPKLSAMKIIEEVEQSKRGLYSGSIGYFTPKGDFDFNVIIRSILYNQEKKYVSFSVGSAITINANAMDEYNECLLKANAMKKVLEQC